MAARFDPKAQELYDQDFYAWSRRQADLLRAGRFRELDLEHLIEEVDDLGAALKRSVRSRIGTIIEQLLKLEHSPAQDPRGGLVRYHHHPTARPLARAHTEYSPRYRTGVRRALRSGARRCRDLAAQARRAGRGRRAAP